VLRIADARRIALAAQGFSDPLPTEKATKRHLHRVIGRTAVLQLDSVNIVARPQYVVPYSRIGPYDDELLRDIAYRDRAWFEYWGHQASLIPIEHYPLFRPRMESFRLHLHAPRSTGKWDTRLHEYLKKERPYMDAVLAQLAERGALSAGELNEAGKSGPGMWNWSRGKQAVEMLFRGGEVAALRRPSFERVYDLPERVIPREVLDAPTLDAEEAELGLVRLAARSLGIGTVADIAWYFNSKIADTKHRVEELTATGELQRVDVEGWTEPGYLFAGTKRPRAVDRSALITPFDPLMWDRRRALRLFGFDYRIEIYTPAPKRVHGYYVLPFLHRERFVARVDLKADRKASKLLVLGAWKEPDATPGDARALSAELARFASFLGLERVDVARKGNFASALRSA
jgi:uncharacterized protein YcaQ